MKRQKKQRRTYRTQCLYQRTGLFSSSGVQSASGKAAAAAAAAASLSSGFAFSSSAAAASASTASTPSTPSTPSTASTYVFLFQMRTIPRKMIFILNFVFHCIENEIKFNLHPQLMLSLHYFGFLLQHLQHRNRILLIHVATFSIKSTMRTNHTSKFTSLHTSQIQNPILKV